MIAAPIPANTLPVVVSLFQMLTVGVTAMFSEVFSVVVFSVVFIIVSIEFYFLTTFLISLTRATMHESFPFFNQSIAATDATMISTDLTIPIITSVNWVFISLLSR